MTNPFYTNEYAGAEYFCDRKKETERLISLLTNGNNIVLMSPRRLGKTGLIQHIFHQEAIKSHYNTFIIDIYATSTLDEMVQCMGNSIVRTLAGKGETALKKFLSIVSSLRAIMTFDQLGNPTWGIERGTIQSPQYTLEQIFNYIETSDLPCIVAIDEFQQIARYPEKNVEAIMRTHIQHCGNGNFIFSGSEQSLLGEMFSSPSHPFFSSTHSYTLDVIPEETYAEFALKHFNAKGKDISVGAIHKTYELFNGITWYMQKVMSELFAQTPAGESCDEKDVFNAVQTIISEAGTTYADILYELSPRQKQLLLAINSEGKATEIKGNTFISKYHLAGASSIQTTIKTLIDKQLVTSRLGVYEVYDKFFSIWLSQNHV